MFWRRDSSRCCPTTPLNKRAWTERPSRAPPCQARIPSVDESQADFDSWRPLNPSGTHDTTTITTTVTARGTRAATWWHSPKEMAGYYPIVQ